jgi:transcriptional regulator with XRE-family HTH domain
MRNRSKRAREQAGLSLAQAAKWLGMSQDGVARIEGSDEAYEAADRVKLAAVYGVDVEWMDGSRAERDYASIDSMRGADNLSFHDRDILAEFAASLPRRPR